VAGKDLRIHVRDQIEKAGYAAELRALRATRLRTGWCATGNQQYLDPEENRLREYDQYASISTPISPESTKCEVVLIVEVKRSESNPWVLMKSSSVVFSNDEREGLTAFRVIKEGRRTGAGSNPPAELFNTIAERSLRAQMQWEGYGLQELTGKPDSTRSYGALVSVCKAAEHEAREAKRRFTSGAEYEFTLVRPVIVLDAHLFSADIDPSGDLVVEDVRYAQVRFKAHRQGKRDVYFIDVVTLAAFDEYLARAEVDLSHLNQQLYSHALSRRSR
jgi:hypothetical protein